jgi:ferric-dicitrate binding protein FerR (iron transport regulator)
MTKKQVLKYIKGDLNSIEKRETIEWIRKSPENQKTYNVLKAEYIASTFKDLPNNTSDFFFERFKSTIKRKRLDKIAYVAISAIAILLLVFNIMDVGLVDTVPQKSSQVTNVGTQDHFSFITERGDKKEVYLPDGSKIVLNVDSELTYPKAFNDSIREVTLLGEAFFDIKRDVNKPFIVNTNNIKIRVLGTSFNVKSYDKDAKVETTLVTGKVELIKGKETPIVLAPSQKAVFHKKENRLEIEEVRATEVVSWKEGTLIFKKTPLKEVAVDLERKYNVNININSKKLLNYEYTGTFDNLSINEVLKLLSISSPIKYTVKGKTITLE